MATSSVWRSKAETVRVRPNRGSPRSQRKLLATGFCGECENDQHDHRRRDQRQVIHSAPPVTTIAWLRISTAAPTGPVLDDKHEVVGVAVMGLNGKVELKTTEFLAVGIAELAKL